MNKQHKELPKYNCSNKTNCSLRSKCQYKSVVYKVEVYCDNNTIKNHKKMYIGSTQDGLKKRFYNHKCSFTHEAYKNSTNLSKYIWEIKTMLGIDPMLKWEIIKKCCLYKADDKFCQLCRKEKLSIISYNSPKELLNHTPEVLNICKHRKNCLLGR